MIGNVTIEQSAMTTWLLIFVPCCRWQQIIEVDHMRAVKGSKHCVQLLEAWEQEGFLYLEMELCLCGRQVADPF